MRLTAEALSAMTLLSVETIEKRLKGCEISEPFMSSESPAEESDSKEALTVAKKQNLEANTQLTKTKLAALEGTLVAVEDVERLGAYIFVAIRQKILGSSMTDDEKHELLTDLSGIKTMDWAKEAKERKG